MVAPLGADRYDGSAVGKTLPTGGGSFVGWQRGAAPGLGVTPELCLGFDDQGVRVSSGDKGAEPPAVRPDLGEDKEAGVAAAIRQTGLRLRNYGLEGNMAAAGRMKRAWGHEQMGSGFVPRSGLRAVSEDGRGEGGDGV